MNTITEQMNWKVSKARDLKWGEPYIQCRYGIITQFDDGDLDIWVMNSRISTRIERIWTAKKHYDDGAAFIRPFSDLDQACLVLKARKRKKVSDKMREAGKRLAERAKAIKQGLSFPRACQ